MCATPLGALSSRPVGWFCFDASHWCAPEHLSLLIAGCEIWEPDETRFGTLVPRSLRLVTDSVRRASEEVD